MNRTSTHPAEGTHLHLIDQVRRRWWLVRALEQSALGWAVGLGLALLLWLWLGSTLVLVVPLIFAAVAALWAEGVTRESAADRVDHVHRTQELFGTVVRLSGGTAHWLVWQADQEAERLQRRRIPLARRGRAWWSGIVLATAAWGTAIVLLPALGRQGADEPAAYQRRGTIVGLATQEPVAPAGFQNGLSRSAGADATAGRPPAGALSGANRLPSSEDGPGGGDAAASRAGSGEGTDPGSAVTPPPADPGPAVTGYPEQANGEAASMAGAGSGALSGDPNASPAQQTPAAASRPAAGESQPAAAVRAGPGEFPERQVPAAYRPLVRAYFATRQDG